MMQQVQVEKLHWPLEDQRAELGDCEEEISRHGHTQYNVTIHK